MKLFVAVVMFVVGSLWMESQARLLQDRQGTNFAEPQVQPQSQQNSPGSVPPLLNAEPSAGTGQANRNQHNERGHPKGESDYIQYWLVALTFLQAIIIFFQTIYTRRDANAAKDNADAALRQVKIMESRERPWVVINVDDIKVRQSSASTPFEFEFKWAMKNIGSSVAFVTELTGEAELVSFPIPNEVPKYPEKEPFAQVILPPNGRYGDRENRSNVPASDGQAFWGGKKAIAYYGIIKYHGAFSGPHCTRFYGHWVWEERQATYSPVGPSKTVEYT